MDKLTERDIEKAGQLFARGFMAVVFKCVMFFALGMIALGIVRNSTGYGQDDSDASPWERSGMQVMTDHKTGVQYLSDGHGGLIRRGE